MSLRKTRLDSIEKITQLTNLIDKDDPGLIKEWFVDIIDNEYTAGEQDEHKRSLEAIMHKYENGMWKPSTKKIWARNKLVEFFTNVAMKGYQRPSNIYPTHKYSKGG